MPSSIGNQAKLALLGAALLSMILVYLYWLAAEEPNRGSSRPLTNLAISKIGLGEAAKLIAENSSTLTSIQFNAVEVDLKEMFPRNKVFPSLATIGFDDCTINGSVHIETLPNLQRVHSFKTCLTRDFCANLATLGIKALAFDGCDLTDDHLIELSAANSLLELLMWRNPGVTDAGVHAVLANSTLEKLVAADSNVVGTCFSPPALLDRLSHLDLKRSNVNSDGCSRIGKIERLLFLNLSGTRIDDRGVMELRMLDKLKVLGLASTSITNESIEVLRRFGELQELNVEGTEIDRVDFMEKRR